jgi:hypothetical protein
MIATTPYKVGSHQGKVISFITNNIINTSSHNLTDFYSVESIDNIKIFEID